MCADGVLRGPRPYARVRERRPDRRTGLATLAASLVPALSRSEPHVLRTVFEEAVRRLVSARVLRLRDDCRPGERAGGSSGQVIALEVPLGDPATRPVLEAIGEPHGRFDDWDRQVLSVASQLAALVLEIERLRTGNRAVAAARPRDGAAPLIGSTPVMRMLREKIGRIAATNFTVLIEGESGTGKELVARQIHDLSARASGPFVALNCAALVETLLEAELFGIEDRTATGVRGRRGKFEHADGGTLFLDEVSDLSLSAQAKLLRAIQDLAVERVGGHGVQRVNVRIVAATNRSLKEMVAAGLFRSDLFFRLSGVEVHVPPLRSRQADILELAEYFLQRYRETRTLRLSPAARDALVAYGWPGNVRELQRVIEGIVALARSDTVTVDDLPLAVRGDYDQVLLPSLERDDTMRAWGSRYARLVLQRCGENKRRACEVLGISYHTLQSYLRYRPRPRTALPAGTTTADSWPPKTDDGPPVLTMES
ncbi:MAG TPA: sigma-54 dependent transcriptional regulator [Vicinamibacterales bacterium]|nr:sigma-54 dependent transcriptional regulator [Vicinamibacterales bacterium]